MEVITDPARTNQAEAVFQQLEGDGTRVLSIAAEAHAQLGKVEKHGHLFEVILQKVLDQIQPSSREEYEQCIVQTMNAKNELINHHGLSPCQLVFGRNPRRLVTGMALSGVRDSPVDRRHCSKGPDHSKPSTNGPDCFSRRQESSSRLECTTSSGTGVPSRRFCCILAHTEV